MHLYTINIGWKETHFYQDTQSRAFNIGWNETFYENTLLYPINIGWKASILDEKKHILLKYKFVHLEYCMKRTHFIKIYICTPSTMDERDHILWKYTFGSHQYWMKSINIGWKETHFIKIQICTPWILDEKNTFYQNIHLYTFNIGWKETHFIKIHFCILSILDEKHKYWMKSINIGWNASILDEKKHILSKYKFVHLQHWMKGNTFYQNTLLYPINIGWKASILDEKHQYWMKSIDIGWRETHFIKIQICTPILDEKNTFYQNIHLFTFNIGWKETHFYQNTQLHAFNIASKETYFIKIPICILPILDEKHQYWMKRNTFYQNTNLYSNIGWKEHILSKYTFVPINIGWKEHILSYFVHLEYYMKKNTYQNTNLYSNIRWKEHILSKYAFVHHQHWMKGNTFLSRYTIPCLQYWMKWNTFYQNTLLYPINIGWKASILDEKKHILLKYKFVQILHEKNTFYQNIHLYTINIGWNETHFIKIHFCILSILDEKHQYWMKSINIGWKASILDEKKHILSKYKFVHLQHWMKGNTFYQNTLLYPINIGWKASILDEKHQYSMKSIDIGWRETHFIKIQICTPILDEKNTFYQNIHLYTFNIGWKETHFIKIHNCMPSILHQKKHILSKYLFVSYQYWFVHLEYMKRNINIGWKETHFIKIQICTPILDEKNTFYQNIHLYTINIGWKETHFYQDIHLYPVPSILDEMKHILSKYTFVSHQYWMKIHYLYHQYWMKSINIGWKETHFIKIQICTPWILDEKKHILSKYTFVHLQHWMKWNTFYENTLLYPINIGWKASILDEKKHILSKYKFVHQYWMKRTHFIKILHLYTFNIGWKETHFIKIHFCIPSILDEKHQYWMKRNTFY